VYQQQTFSELSEILIYLAGDIVITTCGTGYFLKLIKKHKKKTRNELGCNSIPVTSYKTKGAQKIGLGF
jgi:hypothetical protein